ncbi:MAG: hypothetical protein Q8P73_03180 [bacterium]|nr:hypothetical protein [bacterium]
MCDLELNLAYNVYKSCPGADLSPGEFAEIWRELDEDNQNYWLQQWQTSDPTNFHRELFFNWPDTEGDQTFEDRYPLIAARVKRMAQER